MFWSVVQTGIASSVMEHANLGIELYSIRLVTIEIYIYEKIVVLVYCWVGWVKLF